MNIHEEWKVISADMLFVCMHCKILYSSLCALYHVCTEKMEWNFTEINTSDILYLKKKKKKKYMM